MTEEEAKLLAMYRQLSEVGRQFVFQATAGMIEVDKKGLGKK